MKGWETKPRIDPHVLDHELEGFTTAQLLAEVARRERVLREKVDGPVMCEGCVHQRFWTQRRDPPDDWSACKLLHALDFKMPEEPNGEDAGFYKPGGCEDRADPVEPLNVPPPPPPDMKLVPDRPLPRPPRGGKPVGVPVRPA